MGGVVKDPDVARRIARAVVSDIALYNQKKVEEGIAADNLFEVLRGYAVLLKMRDHWVGPDE